MDRDFRIGLESLGFRNLGMINDILKIKSRKHNSEMYGNGNAAVEISDQIYTYFFEN